KEQSGKEKEQSGKEKEQSGKEKEQSGKEKEAKLRLVAERLAKPEYAQILGKAFSDGKFDLSNPEHQAKLEAALKSDAKLRKELFDAARANDEETGGSDLKFFATQFRDLGVIDHAEFRKIFEEAAPKPETDKRSPTAGPTVLAGNYSATGDGRTFFALDRAGSDGRKFDEFVRVSPDGKTVSKEIVGRYGYSLTVEPVPNETGETAAKESELADAKTEK
ncbi:MAG: hypothetical protein QG650_1158, partial [Patescibacteria group bacterium]|nr:hypothetical protein [Patescibacteria group bacterium]